MTDSTSRFVYIDHQNDVPKNIIGFVGVYVVANNRLNVVSAFHQTFPLPISVLFVNVDESYKLFDAS